MLLLRGLIIMIILVTDKLNTYVNYKLDPFFSLKVLLEVTPKIGQLCIL